jgi:hypothetical protein
VSFFLGGTSKVGGTEAAFGASSQNDDPNVVPSWLVGQVASPLETTLYLRLHAPPRTYPGILA